MDNKDKLIQNFQIPAEGWDLLDDILDPKEQALLLHFDNEAELPAATLLQFYIEQGFVLAQPEAEQLLQQMFRRGVLNKTEQGTYCIGSFYGRLDIFATSETAHYYQLTREKRVALDRWYFKQYVDGMEPDLSKQPTLDEVLPLQEVLKHIDTKEEQAYLAHCDCRMLIQNCEKPTETCITYRTAPNSFVKRGYARPISKEEAKQVVVDADKNGLMHTVNPGGICNCCTDCCYLFRAASYRGSAGLWPKVHYHIALKTETCIGCGRCVKRCHFQVLSCITIAGKKKAVIDTGKVCVGCGICATGCGVQALSLQKTGEV